MGIFGRLIANKAARIVVDDLYKKDEQIRKTDQPLPHYVPFFPFGEPKEPYKDYKYAYPNIDPKLIDIVMEPLEEAGTKIIEEVQKYQKDFLDSKISKKQLLKELKKAYKDVNREVINNRIDPRNIVPLSLKSRVARGFQQKLDQIKDWLNTY